MGQTFRLALGKESQLVERLSEGILPAQFAREFTQNGFEAIEEYRDKYPNENYKGKVHFTIDREYLKTERVNKLCVIDTGIGMDGFTLVKNLLNLGESSEYKDERNYGVGAKISAVTRNPEGLMYQSWQKNEKHGNMVYFFYNNETNQYEIQDFGESEKQLSIPISNDKMPQIIKEAGHGTKVTFFGTSKNIDTTNKEAHNIRRGGKDAWIHTILNERYYDIPDYAEMKTLHKRYDNNNNLERFYEEDFKPLKKSLAERTKQIGTVYLDGFRIEWRIIDVNKNNNSRELSRSHCAVIVENEIFYLSNSNSNILRDFGINYPGEIVIHVHPDKEKGFNQDIFRRNILGKNGEEFPWEEIFVEFKKKFPLELKKYQDELNSKMKESSSTGSIKEKLEKRKHLYKINKIIQNPTGNINANKNENTYAVAGSTTDFSKLPDKRNKKLLKKKKKQQGLSEEVISDLHDGSKNKASSINSPWEKFIWVDENDSDFHKLGIKDTISGKAASYEPSINTIYGNSNYSRLIEDIDYYQKQNSRISAEFVPPVIKESYELKLLEYIAVTNEHNRKKDWDENDYNNAISPASLTAAVGIKYHSELEIKEELNKIRDKMNDPKKIENQISQLEMRKI